MPATPNAMPSIAVNFHFNMEKSFRKNRRHHIATQAGRISGAGTA
jgi:hypothetical protein